MAFVVDDIVEAALGPWGVVLGLGVGAVVASRRRWRPLAATASGAVAPLTASASGVIAPLAGAAGTLAWVGGRVPALQSIPGRERGQALFFELTRSVTDLYTEAKSEFEANQATRGQRWAERGERAEDIVSQRSVARDARGRFVKRSPA